MPLQKQFTNLTNVQVLAQNITTGENGRVDSSLLGGSSSTTNTIGTVSIYRGVNMAGAEFAHTAATLPGVYGTDYAYDSLASLQYIASLGHKVVRLPLRWERLQPARNAALNAAELARITQFVTDAASTGMKTLLDVHNYAEYIESTANGGLTKKVGTAQLPLSDLTDLWTRLSTAFKNNTGVYGYGLMNEPHSLTAVLGGFSGTIRYDWNNGTVQSWTGDSATSTNVANKLRLAKTTTAGTVQVRKDDAGAILGGAGLSGNVIQLLVTQVSGTNGDWQTKVQWQDQSYSYKEPSNVTYIRTDTNAIVTGLVAGVETKVICEFATNPITNPRAFAIEFDANNATAQTVQFDVDDFAQGSLASSQTPAQVWEGMSQMLVNAIRANNDNTLIVVPGYFYSSAKLWATNHPVSWITDPAENFEYEAHYYFDEDNSGQYLTSYATANSAAISSGFANLSARAIAEISNFTNWLTTNNQKGFIGELGWPNTGDTVGWNGVGHAIYSLLDTKKVGATYWATGARWGTGYLLSAYTGDPLSTPKSQATVIEAHKSIYEGAGLTLAQLAQLNQATADNTAQAGQITALQSSKLTKNTAITGATKTKVTYDANGLVTAGTDATASDILNVPAGSITATNVQSAINTIASRLTVEEAKSTSTKKGNLPTGGAKASPVVINPASMPLSLVDGDYYTVNTVNSATANYYDLTAIGYGIVNAGLGAKISFNATQNEYIFQNAGENQIASEVPVIPSAASSTAIGTVSTNQENLNTEYKTAIKTALENLGVFVPLKDYLAGNVIVENNKIYKANTSFTSGATFLVTDWTEISAGLKVVTPTTYANLAAQTTATLNNQLTKDTTTGNIVIKDIDGNVTSITPSAADVEAIIVTTLTAGTGTITTTATQPALTALVTGAMTGEITIVNRITGEMWRRIKGETIFDLIQGRQQIKGLDFAGTFDATLGTVVTTADTNIINTGALPTASDVFEGVALEVATAGVYATIDYQIGDIIYCENTGSGFAWNKLDLTPTETLSNYLEFGTAGATVTQAGDNLDIVERLTLNHTIVNATLIITSGTFPATPTTLKIKSNSPATDYITVVVPANATVGTPATSVAINTPVITATPALSNAILLNSSQAVTATYVIKLTTKN